MRRNLVLSCLLLPCAALAALRPPAVPLVANDPYFSVWDMNEVLNCRYTEHWSGARQPLTILAEVDDKTWRLCGFGVDYDDFEPARQLSVEVRPLTSVYRFAAGSATVTVSFMTPKMADDLDVYSRPVTYVTVKTSGAAKVKVTASIEPSWATHDDSAKMVKKTAEFAGLSAYAWGRATQRPLSREGDWDRPDWGWAWIVNPVSIGMETHFMLAFEDGVSLNFLGKPCREWWTKSGITFAEMIARAEHDYAHLKKKAAKFDAEQFEKMKAVGGEKYAELASLAYRQSLAACKLVVGPDGQPLHFPKENASCGFIGTTDVIYPQLPLLLYISPTLAKATLEPTLAYAASGQWPYPFAPHDLGYYPRADGQRYRMDLVKESGDVSQLMPVEECGNMLLCLCAISMSDGNADFAGRWWMTATGWAEYLEKIGVDPDSQLCTDDFAGHLGHNANLSVKTILALAAYGKMAGMRGDRESAERYAALARESAERWQKLAAGGALGGYRLAFDRNGSWSQKYNLVWDRLLGLGIFPRDVAEREMKAYRALAKDYGLPLDCRSDYTKTDWTVWSATLTGRMDDFDFFIGRIHRFANDTPDRVPFADWYWATTGRYRGFRARPVIGGVFLPMIHPDFALKTSMIPNPNGNQMVHLTPCL